MKKKKEEAARVEMMNDCSFNRKTSSIITNKQEEQRLTWRAHEQQPYSHLSLGRPESSFS